MLTLNVVDDDVVSRRLEFDPSLFFSVMRDAGSDPVVWGGALYLLLPKPSKFLEDVQRTAALLDPAGEIRIAYAKRAWDARPIGAEIVKLG
jgi:hypothetical protein